MDFAAIQADVAQLQHTGHLCQQQDLHKQLLDFRQKVLAKVGNRVMIWVQSTCNVSKWNTFIGGSFSILRELNTPVAYP